MAITIKIVETQVPPRKMTEISMAVQVAMMPLVAMAPVSIAIVAIPAMTFVMMTAMMTVAATLVMVMGVRPGMMPVLVNDRLVVTVQQKVVVGGEHVGPALVSECGRYGQRETGRRHNEHCSGIQHRLSPVFRAWHEN